MVEEGRLSADEAISLIEALDGSAAEAESEDYSHGPGSSTPGLQSPGPASYENKMLRIIVDSAQGDKVNIQLPVKIIRQILKVTGKLPIQSDGLKDIDLDHLTASILECLDNETLGNIVDVDAADGTTVKVLIG